MGAILSMRKAHRHRIRKAYLAAARFQLLGIRKRVEFEIQQGHYDLDVTELREHAMTIVEKADSVHSPLPSNDDLLQQLYKYMESLKEDQA